MFSVQRFRELFSTLRFRLALWIMLVMFMMVVVKNYLQSEVAERTLRYKFDQFLKDSLEEVHLSILRNDPEKHKQLLDSLDDKVKAYEYRNWFLQLYDENGRLMWGSNNAPPLTPPAFAADAHGPYDTTLHRVLERRLQRASGEIYYVRCGFLQLALQEDIDLLNQNLLVASISILLFAPLGGYIIGVLATRPIAHIIATASDLHPTNLKERLPIRGTGDEIDQLSGTINSMLDRLASFITQNRDFVANAAHELRSPLAAIRASVEVGLNQNRSEEEYAYILADVMEEINRLAGLVNRMLILAEGDAGRLGPRTHVTRLGKVVVESVEMFDAVAELRGVQLTIAESSPALVRGDETNLRQVVRNLIDNAIKYTGNPGAVVVSLRTDPIKKQVILVVKDSGIGISKDVLPRIFERFYRVDKSRTRETERIGYGLGLSICRTIVEALKGEITVESTVGQGSTFSVRLPLAEDTAGLTQSEEKSLPLPAGS